MLGFPRNLYEKRERASASGYRSRSAATWVVWSYQLHQPEKKKKKKNPITPLPTYVDNQATIILSSNPVQPGRNLHIHARYFYVRDLVARQELMVVKIHTNDQLADILVSFKSFETFLRLRTLLLNCAYVVVVPQREANVADKLEWVATYLM